MSTEEQILETAEKIKTALFNQDTEALTQLFAEDYRSFDIRGLEENRDLTLSVYKSGGADMEVYDMDEVQVNVFGEVGIMTGRGTIRGKFEGHVFGHIIRFTDVYILREHGWQVWISHATEILQE